MKRLVLGLLFGEICFGHSFMPENDLHKQDRLSKFENISSIEFDKAIAEAEEFYAPLFKMHNAELVIVKKWDDPTVNAYATQIGSRWEVHMFGGLARRKEITPDGFQLVICHEVGHHLAGFPFVQSWAANEGQSDYFATQSCGRRLWEDDVEKNAIAAQTIPIYPKQLCDAAWSSVERRNLCYRVAQAGFSLAALLSSGSARYETPSKQVVARTYNQHPAGQCRLDTYMAGALCVVKFDVEVIPKTEKDSAEVSCLSSRKDIGFRPTCWFKPAI